jgi:hypothetical protein
MTAPASMPAGTPNTPSQHVIYNPGTGFLYYDPDGSGPSPEVHFATLTPHLALTHSYFVIEA